MQLKDQHRPPADYGAVGALLSAATCSLLLMVPVTATASDNEQPWRVDMGAMHYSEEDRITVNEATVRLKHQFDEDTSLTVRVGYDSVSGASPTGAVKIQSKSGASGTSYLADFSAARHSIGADLDTPVGEQLRLTLNADHSTQETYDSSGIGATLAKDMNQRNTTLVAGIGYSRDNIKPSSGIHYGLDSTTSTDIRKNSEEKEQIDVQIGITQVLARGTLAQLNYVHSQAYGYMTNPYKIISVVNEFGSTSDYDARYEKRPRNRTSHVIFTQLNQSVGNDVAYVSYRYFHDDWGIVAHTLDLRYRHPLGERSFIQPHVRYYQQSAADFYRSMLLNTEVSNLPDYASADYRMAKLQTTSVGVKLGYRPRSGGELNLRFEVIRQDGEQQPVDAVGIQRDAGVFPTLNATMVNVSYTTPF